MPHTVHLLPSGHRFVAGGDESVLEAALRHGLILPYGCRNGACGACKGRVVEGRIRYPGERPEGIDPAEDEGGFALLCQARAVGDLAIEVPEIQQAGELQARRYAVRISGLERLSHDVIRLRLELPRAERMQFIAGQYIDLITRSGHRRAFSLANPPHHDHALELHIRHVAGGEFTERLFEQSRVGEVLQIDGPHGSFRLNEGCELPAVMVGGGTGLAPLKALIEHAIHRGLTRPVQLYWGVRARRDLYLPELPLRWAADHRWFSYTPVLSEPSPSDGWQGRTGWVHEAVLADLDDPDGVEVYACGPPEMVKAVHDALRARGLPGDRFFSDPFEYGALAD